MIGLILTGHGVFLTGMHQPVSVVAEEQPNIQAVPFSNSTGLGVSGSNTRRVVSSVLRTYPAVVVLADLLRGIPFRISVTVVNNYQNVEVSAGVSLSMVLERFALHTISTDVEDFTPVITDSVRDRIVHEKLKRPQTSTQEETDEV